MINTTNNKIFILKVDKLQHNRMTKMTSDECEVYGVLGPPKTQPRSLDFEKVRGWKVSGRKGRGEKFSPESLSNLSINDQTKNGDEVALETENSLEQRIHTGKEIQNQFTIYSYYL